jgi:hypothetical protein
MLKLVYARVFFLKKVYARFEKFFEVCAWFCPSPVQSSRTSFWVTIIVPKINKKSCIDLGESLADYLGAEKCSRLHQDLWYHRITQQLQLPMRPVTFRTENKKMEQLPVPRFQSSRMELLHLLGRPGSSRCTQTSCSNSLGPSAILSHGMEPQEGA